MTMSKEARENIEQLHSRLDCDLDDVIDEVEGLLLLERWFNCELKEPARSEAYKWLNKFGYKEEE